MTTWLVPASFYSLWSSTSLSSSLSLFSTPTAAFDRGLAQSLQVLFLRGSQRVHSLLQLQPQQGHYLTTLQGCDIVHSAGVEAEKENWKLLLPRYDLVLYLSSESATPAAPTLDLLTTHTARYLVFSACLSQSAASAEFQARNFHEVSQLTRRLRNSAELPHHQQHLWVFAPGACGERRCTLP